MAFFDTRGACEGPKWPSYVFGCGLTGVGGEGDRFLV